MKYILLFLIVFSAFAVNYSFADCASPQGKSFYWPDMPCHDAGESTEERKRDWAPYYYYKGQEWMEQKTREIESLISEGLDEDQIRDKWIGRDENFIPQNYYFWEYYKLFKGEAPPNQNELVFAALPETQKTTCDEECKAKRENGIFGAWQCQKDTEYPQDYLCYLGPSDTRIAIPTDFEKKAKMFWKPRTVSIWVNNTITWTNSDDTQHTIISKEGLFEPRQINPKSSFSFVFAGTGDFQYYLESYPDIQGTITVIPHDPDYREEEPIRRGTNNSHKTQMVFRDNQDHWKTIDRVTILDGSNTVLLSTSNGTQQSTLDIGGGIIIECTEKQNLYSEQSSLVLERIDAQNRLVHFMLNTKIFPNTSCKDGVGTPQDIQVEPVQIPQPEFTLCDEECKDRVASSASQYFCKKESKGYMCAQESPIQPTIYLTHTDETGKQKVFRPSDITVSLGINNTVRWSNAVYATTISNQEQVYDSIRIPFGDIGFQVLDKPGNYVFYDESEPDVKVNVTVIPLDEKYNAGKPITKYTKFPDVRYQTFRADQDHQNFIHNVSIIDSDSVSVMVDNTMDSQYAANKNPESTLQTIMSVGDRITSGCTYHHDTYSRVFYHALTGIDFEGNTAEFKETLEYVPENKCVEFYSDPNYVVSTLAVKTFEDIQPPLMQLRNGVTIDEIQCKQNLVLIQKYNGSPACVTESTKQKLIAQVWAEKKDEPNKPLSQKWTYPTEGEISSIDISEDDSIIVIGTIIEDTQNGMVYLLDNDGMLLWKKEFDSMIGRVEISNDVILAKGYHMCGGTVGARPYCNYTADVFDVTGNKKQSYTHEDKTAFSASLSPEGSGVITNTHDTLEYSNLNESKSWTHVPDKPIDWATFLTDSKIIVKLDNTGEIFALDNAGNKIWNFTTIHQNSYSYAISNDGEYFVVSDDGSPDDGNIYLLNSNGDILWQDNIGDTVLHLAFSRDGSRILVEINDAFMIYDVQGNLQWKNNIPSDLAISSDGSFLVGTTFNQGSGASITLFDGNGNILSNYPASKQSLSSIFALANNDEYLVMANDTKIAMFEVNLDFDYINYDLTALRNPDDLHVKVVPTNKELLDVAIAEGDFIEIPWDIMFDDGFTRGNFRVSIESDSDIESWITPTSPYTAINGIPPDEKIITIRPIQDAKPGIHTTNILGEGDSIHNQTGWMTNLDGKTLGTINVSVIPKQDSLSIKTGQAHSERGTFCVDFESESGTACTGMVTYQKLPITVFSNITQTITLEATTVQKGGWIKFVPNKIVATPNGTTSDMFIAGYLIPFSSNPSAEKPLIIEASSENESTTIVIPIRFGTISLINDEPSPIKLDKIRANSNGTHYSISNVVYDPLDSDSSGSIPISFSVLGMWDDGNISDLPDWLSVNIPKKSFVLNATSPHHFMIVVHTENAPVSGTYHIAINENIDGKSFTQLQELIIENIRH